MKFTHLYEELKLLDICKPVSPEEAKQRDIEGPAILLKEIVDGIKKKIKLPDGTWRIRDDLNLFTVDISTLENLNVSIVDGSFICNHNSITSLKGGPKKVKGSFYCNNNKLTSLEGCPKEVGGYFDCYNNTKKFTEDEVRTLCNVKGEIRV